MPLAFSSTRDWKWDAGEGEKKWERKDNKNIYDRYCFFSTTSTTTTTTMTITTTNVQTLSDKTQLALQSTRSLQPLSLISSLVYSYRCLLTNCASSLLLSHTFSRSLSLSRCVSLSCSKAYTYIYTHTKRLQHPARHFETYTIDYIRLWNRLHNNIEKHCIITAALKKMTKTRRRQCWRCCWCWFWWKKT